MICRACPPTWARSTVSMFMLHKLATPLHSGTAVQPVVPGVNGKHYENVSVIRRLCRYQQHYGRFYQGPGVSCVISLVIASSVRRAHHRAPPFILPVSKSKR